MISYIGMKTREVAIASKIEVSLAPDTEVLDEVLVVGYGTTKREAKTGSIATVEAGQIADIPASSLDKMLAGKMAGVQITSASGQPGSNSQIRIRGISSINAGNEPLYVVDGIPVMTGDQSYFTNTSNAIAMINPNDIESITVLKDAASASVYGSRAANGVILVTTKSGKEGKSRIGVRAKYGVSQFANDNDYGVMTGKELLGYQRQAIINAGMNPDDPSGVYYRPMELLTRQQTNWMDHFTRLGKMQEYEINLSGGSQRTKYYSSISYHDNEGVFYGVDFQKMQARINADHELNNQWKTGVRINAGYMYGEDVPMQDLYYTNPAFAGITILPWTPAYNEDGSHNTLIPENSNNNPRATAIYDEQWEKQYRFNGSFYLEYKPIKGLTLKTTNAAELNFTEGRRYWSLEASNDAAGYPVLQTSTMKYQYLTTSNTATYEGLWDKHNYRLLLGQEASHRYSNEFYHSSQNLNPDIPHHISGNSTNDVAYGEGTETLMSFFGILDYSYDSRYYLQASARYDASSKFGKNNQWGLFWSVGLSWNAHNEAFLKDVDWIQMLKVRASYGINGNNNIANYKQYGLYSSTVYNGITGMIPSSPANDDLSWEKNKSWNAGIDFTFFKKLSGSIDFYTRTTDDMLLYKNLSGTSGFGSALQNIGSMRNTGIELQMDYKVIENKDWLWEVGFNIAHNKSKILELAGDEMMSYSNDSRIKHIVGEQMFTFYLKDYYGVNPVNGEALWVTEDGSLSNDYNQAAWIKAGSPEPKYTGGINTSLTWKDLTLSIVGEFKGGNKVFIVENRYLQSDGNQMSMNQAKSLLNYWQKPGDTGCNPKPVAGNSSNSYSYSSDRFIEDGDYFRIKDITLSYNVPSKWLSRAGIGSLKVYGSALNLFTFHDVNFWDPERGVDGMGYGVYPQTKTFVIGLDLSF
jgi:TonB-linked SusC/RagA family outer membrane protein